MVFLLTTPVGSGHIRNLVGRFGRSFGRDLVEMTYSEFVRRGSAVAGAYVFTDRIRMSEPFRQIAADLWNQISELGSAVRLYNHPLRQLGRYELLRELHRRGLNDFNIFRLDEIDQSDLCFPVFLRMENDHGGPRSGLIPDRDALWMEIGKLLLAGADPSHLVVTEFLDTAGEDGIYRKFGAWRFGSLIMGQHCLMAEDWNVKAEVRIRSQRAYDETDEYFFTNPHEHLLMPYFEVAQIEYGRIDYSFYSGKVQVWEINDNPQFFGQNPMFRTTYAKGERIRNAYRVLDDGMTESGSMTIDPLRSWMRERVPVS